LIISPLNNSKIVVKDTAFYSNGSLNLGGDHISLRPALVMGILNINPDSFFDGGKYTSAQAALKQALKMAEEGADIIDLGPASSKPGEDLIDPSEEWRRLKPVLELLQSEAPQLKLSLDTYNSQTADRALNAGVQMINDISGGAFDSQMFETVARYKVPYVLMHMKGTPSNMNKMTDYKNILSEVSNYFSERLEKLYALGLNDVILDLGFGFAKTMEQNYQLMANLDYFKANFKNPLLVGISRKSMISKLLNINKSDALNGTSVLNSVALSKGANILRVHDVAPAKEAVKILTFTQNSA
jgi:dihydropteroate synthase